MTSTPAASFDTPLDDFEDDVLPVAASTRVDLPLSRELSRRVRARNRECYRNAVLALQSDAELAAAGVVYVEGFVVEERTGMCAPIEHAWLERPDGTVIDPTPIFCTGGTNTRSYFRGYSWSRDEAFELCMAPNATYTFHLRLPGRGQEVESWNRAAESAHRAANALNVARIERLRMSFERRT